MHDEDAGLAWEILHRYADPATAEFDRVVAGAGLPEDVARALRFWQRESVHNVKQFAAEALPAVFAAIAAAQHDAADATRRAGSALAGPRVRGDLERAADPGRTISLPDVSASTAPSVSRLEERRRTVAARLAELG